MSLSVIRIFSVFPEEVFVKELFLHRRKFRVQRERMILHKSNFLQNNSRLDSLSGCFPPAERTMTLKQEPRGSNRDQGDLKCLNDHFTSFLLVIRSNLSGMSFAACTGIVTVEIIRMRRARRLDRHARLGKTRCPAAVRVNDPAYIRERFI